MDDIIPLSVSLESHLLSNFCSLWKCLKAAIKSVPLRVVGFFFFWCCFFYGGKLHTLNSSRLLLEGISEEFWVHARRFAAVRQLFQLAVGAWSRARCGSPSVVWRGRDDLTHVIMVKCVGSRSCFSARAQLGAESAALRLVAAFVLHARGVMQSMIVKDFYCSYIWSHINVGIGTGLAPYFADLG